MIGSQPSPKVLVADGHRLFAEAVSRVLRSEYRFVVPDALAVSAQQTLSAGRREKPDVILLDHWIPGMEAPAVVRLLVSTVPDCKVILLSWLFSVEQIRDGLEAGAVGFLSKSISLETVAQAIHRAFAGESPVYEQQLDDMIRKIDERSRGDDVVWQKLSTLTPREIEILKLMDAGLLIEQVARRLEIKPSTVRNHVHSILGKTGTQTHMQAVAMARHHGLIGR